MRLMTLDPSSHCGWSRWADGYDRPAFGVQHFQGSIGRKAMRFREWLRGKIVADQIEEIAIEQSYNPQGGTTYDTLRQQLGFNVIVHEMGELLGIPIEEVPLVTWRSRVLGVTKAPAEIKGSSQRSKWMKRKAVDHCQRRGWSVEDDNAAEALCVLEFVRSVRDHNYGISTTPLFSGRAA